ncbi:hypothetical protein ACHAXS_009182 [Conticribra weissflogii]
MKSVPEILHLTALELSHHLGCGKITATRLMAETLDRIDDINPSVRAIVALRDRKRLMEEAYAADLELKNYIDGKSTDEKNFEKRWLLGIPIAIKDISHAKGFPTTMGGCTLYGEELLPNGHDAANSMNSTDAEQDGKYHVFGKWKYKSQTEDDPYVKRLRDAAPELAMGCHSYNSLHGTTLNPANPSLSSGGSSGGAAAALASYMLCVSDGSDMMGSLRNPAGWNRLYSLRPTAGWMEDDVGASTQLLHEESEVLELPYPISTPGPMARCPEDVAMFLQTMLPGGKSKLNATLINNQSNEELDKLIKTIKLGWLGDFGGSFLYDHGILSHCKSSLEKFQCIGGACVESISDAPFSSGKLWDAWMAFRSRRILMSIHECIGGIEEDIPERLKASNVKPEAVWECESALGVTSQQLQQATKVVEEWSSCIDELFQTYDYLVLPSSQVYPFDASLDWPKSIAGKSMDTYHRWMEVMVPVTLLGVPCVTIPAGGETNGLHNIGLQIFGPKDADAGLLSLARWYHLNINMNTN